jgi:hypothetical protein
MRIAVDLDGVLADMESELIRHARDLFGSARAESLQRRAAEQPAPTVDTSGPDVPASLDQTTPRESGEATPPISRLRMSGRQEDQLWRRVQSIENFWEKLDELEPGAVARLAATAAERRWEIIFLTKRPETLGATSQLQTQRWLHAKGFTLPSVYVVQNSRGLIGAALGLDVVIDDTPQNCIDIAVDSKARPILVWRQDEAQIPSTMRTLGVEIVPSFNACLDMLVALHSAESEPVSVFHRVRRLLGSRKTAARG